MDDVKDLDSFYKYIENYSKNNPEYKDICNSFLQRMESLNGGKALEVESTNKYDHYISVTMSVGVPNNMDIGEILKELKNIEENINKTSTLKVKINL